MASDIEATDAASDGAGTVRIRAAQYVRMSTENQKYSTTNQTAAIGQYASKRGMDIVRTYADRGKSGLSIEGRDSLKLLMSDVQEGRADLCMAVRN
jgi:DNA invertase Pin-like site-specific DNA recombinase